MNPRWRSVVLAAIAALLVAMSGSAASGTADARTGAVFSVTDLGTLPGDSSSVALGLNASGQAVGYSQRMPGSATRAVLFSNGGVVDLGVSAAGLRSRALAINATGQVAGYAAAGPYGVRAALFPGGAPALLPLPQGDVGGAAFAANASGQTVGYTENTGTDSNRPDGGHAALFSGGAATPLGALAGDLQSAAYAINDAGQAVGYSQGAARQHAVLFSKGGVIDLGTLPGDSDSGAFSINRFGVAVGYSAGGGHFHAALFAAGRVFPLGVPAGQQNSQALSVNNLGIAVGFSDGDGVHRHAVVFIAGKAIPLDALLPANSGWTLLSANAINDNGQIVGQGLHSGQTHAFLLNPNFAGIGAAIAAATQYQLPPDINPAPPATLAPTSPTVRVRYDYMVLPGPDGHSDAPDPAAIQAVVDAFAAHGIRLSIEPTHAAIPERYVLGFDLPGPLATGPDAVDFDALKTTYFPNAPSSIHYTIFGFFSACDTPARCGASPVIRGTPPAFGQTGQAEILPGMNFIVSLGHFLYDQGIAPTLFNVGGTFMHELGHNLGLHHAGGLAGGIGSCIAPACEDLPLFKPNYLSVMNYKYQFSGILRADTVGSNVIDPALTRVDYSEQTLPSGGNTPGALDENGNLNEPAGLGSGNADIFTFDDGSCGFQIAATNGPVDWNGDGVPDNTHATADLNEQDHPLSACTVTTQVLRGHPSDWSLILASLQTPRTLALRADPVIANEAGTETLMTEHALYPILRLQANLWRDRAGRIQVTLRGSHSLDVTQVVPSSLRMLDHGPARITITDTNGDGIPDLVIEAAGQINSRATQRVLVTGWMKNSQAFYAVSHQLPIRRAQCSAQGADH